MEDRVDYCVQSWYPYLRTDIDVLEKVQKGLRDHSKINLFDTMKDWLNYFLQVTTLKLEDYSMI